MRLKACGLGFFVTIGPIPFLTNKKKFERNQRALLELHDDDDDKIIASSFSKQTVLQDKTVI